MELSRFNPVGLRLFQEFIDSCTSDAPQPYPESALTDVQYSEIVSSDIDLESRSFASRFELAAYLDTQFEPVGFRPARNDPGLWAWLACLFFKEICPKWPDGSWKPGSIPRWIPRSSDFRRYYRHLVAGPYLIYRAHRDRPTRALAALCQRPGSPGDLVEQLASRQQIITNRTIMQVATDLFVDAQAGKQKRSANSKGPGGPRRLIDVLAQFDVTWDLSMMSPEDLRARLPKEFQVGNA
jgi:hypothetical protein